MTTTPDKIQDVLEVEGVNAKGYGNAPKLVMQDHRLTIEAKAIYCYFSSFCGGGTTEAFPSVDKILHDLQIGRERYYKHFSLLTDYGYIAVRQVRLEQGTYAKNIFTLVSHPKSAQKSAPKSGFPTTVHPTTVHPTTDNPTANRNSLNKNSININREKKGEGGTPQPPPNVSSVSVDKDRLPASEILTVVESYNRIFANYITQPIKAGGELTDLISQRLTETSFADLLTAMYHASKDEYWNGKKDGRFKANLKTLMKNNDRIQDLINTVPPGGPYSRLWGDSEYDAYKAILEETGLEAPEQPERQQDSQKPTQFVPGSRGATGFRIMSAEPVNKDKGHWDDLELYKPKGIDAKGNVVE